MLILIANPFHARDNEIALKIEPCRLAEAHTGRALRARTEESLDARRLEPTSPRQPSADVRQAFPKRYFNSGFRKRNVGIASDSVEGTIRSSRASPPSRCARDSIRIRMGAAYNSVERRSPPDAWGHLDRRRRWSLAAIVEGCRARVRAQEIRMPSRRGGLDGAAGHCCADHPVRCISVRRPKAPSSMPPPRLRVPDGQHRSTTATPCERRQRAVSGARPLSAPIRSPSAGINARGPDSTP